MKKRILFCIENFHHGGITKALENFVSLIDHGKYDVKVFVVNQEDGPYKKFFKPFLAYRNDCFLNACCTNYRKHFGFKKYCLLGFKSLRKIMIKMGLDPFKIRLTQISKKISKDHYDCVIAYAEGYVTEFVSSVSVKKVAWIHIDYKRYLMYANYPKEQNIYSKFDSVIIPSSFSSQSFKDIYPEFKDRVRILPNLINTKKVRDSSFFESDEDTRFKTDKFTIISVGRVCHEKRFYEIPNIARKLRDMGADFYWYVVGNGSPQETVSFTDSIVNNGVSEFVIPLGGKDNPYPYIKNSNILVSTSLSETFSYVVFEAKTLGVPVVCADFGTAPEIINSTEGVIANIENMAGVIYKMYSTDSLSIYQQNLKDYRYNNERILQEFTEIIG